MSKGTVYLCIFAVGAFALWKAGLFGGSDNLKARTAYWQDLVARELPQGASQGTLKAFAARQNVALECFTPSVRPLVNECRGYDPLAKGGTQSRPVGLLLSFVFPDDKFSKFESNLVPLK